ncbi:MAG: InlB B-repeat-containing protein [Candidatus Paceibacterota bacterium]
MKHQTLIFLLASVMLIVGFSCGCKKEPAPVVPHTYTVSFNVNGGNGSIASQSVTAGNSFTFPSGSSLTYTGYTFQSWNTSADGTGTSYNAGSTFVPTGNITFFAIWQKNAPVYTAVISSTGTYDASTTAVDKVLLGRSVAKAFVLNVTTAGTAKIDVIGSLSNSNPAIAEYWINTIDNTDLNVAASTLNATKVAITSSSFTVKLNVGINVICFKTVAYSGSIANGVLVGLKVTGANEFTLANASYTADASYNVAAVQKQEHKTNNTVTVSANTESDNGGWGIIQLTPYSDEAGTVYDGTLYPKILSLTLRTTPDWSTGDTTGWSKLDFTNARGTSGQYFDLKQDNSTTGSSFVFSNSNAFFSNNSLQFQLSNAAQLNKSFMGNYSFIILHLNVFNTNPNPFGSANVSFVYKSVKYVGNPETWVYNTAGVRVQ